jgi:hypothetical protein
MWLSDAWVEMVNSKRNGFEDRRSCSLTSTGVHRCRKIRLYHPSPSTGVHQRFSLDVVQMLYGDLEEHMTMIGCRCLRVIAQ